MDKNIFYFEWLEGKEGVGSGAFFNNYEYILELFSYRYLRYLNLLIEICKFQNFRLIIEVWSSKDKTV